MLPVPLRRQDSVGELFEILRGGRPDGVERGEHPVDAGIEVPLPLLHQAIGVQQQRPCGLCGQMTTATLPAARPATRYRIASAASASG